MTDDTVTRLYRCLVEELDRRGHPESHPVKVSQIYQELVPYRAVRPALGVELNADYEHALLRLLAGERGLLRLEPEQAREELEREVAQPYPFVGMFRKFSASDVWIRREADPAAADPVAAEEPAAEPAGEAAPARKTGSGRRGARRAAPAGDGGGRAAEADGGGRPRRVAGAGAAAPVQLHRDPETAPAPAAGAESLPAAGTPCAFCADELPAGRRVRFCPHCGGDQRLRPCPRCDAVLERDWRYCISCGHEMRVE